MDPLIFATSYFT